MVLHVEPHTFFERHEDDILCQIPISFVQAALGEDIEVPTLNGAKKAHHPARNPKRSDLHPARPGHLHLDGFGKGDQHVQITVKVPANLNKRQRELLKEFAAQEGKGD